MVQLVPIACHLTFNCNECCWTCQMSWHPCTFMQKQMQQKCSNEVPLLKPTKPGLNKQGSKYAVLKQHTTAIYGQIFYSKGQFSCSSLIMFMSNVYEMRVSHDWFNHMYALYRCISVTEVASMDYWDWAVYETDWEHCSLDQFDSFRSIMSRWPQKLQCLV